MEVLKFIASGYLILSGIILIIGAFCNIRINRTYCFLVIGIALSVAVFGFCLEPTSGLDLYRLWRFANALDFNHGNAIISILGLKEVSISLAGSSMTGMISFRALCYIVRCIGDLHWMSAISCFVTFSILLLIIVDYVVDTGGSSKQLFLYIMITFMGLQVSYVMQGIRNAMAVAFCVWGLYLKFYKKREGILPYVLYFIAVTMHAMVLIIAPIALLTKLKNQTAVRVIALFTMPLLFWVANKSSIIGLGFVNYLSERILFYTDVAYQYDRPEMIADIAVFIVIAMSYWFYSKQRIISVTNSEKTYFNAYILLGIAMISCVQRRDFALRIGYLMGVGAIPLLNKLLFTEHSNTENHIGSRIVHMGIVLSIIVCSSKVAYDMWYVLSRMTFN